MSIKAAGKKKGTSARAAEGAEGQELVRCFQAGRRGLVQSSMGGG